jgi:hypothetical protein
MGTSQYIACQTPSNYQISVKGCSSTMKEQHKESMTAPIERGRGRAEEASRRHGRGTLSYGIVMTLLPNLFPGEGVNAYTIMLEVHS